MTAALKGSLIEAKPEGAAVAVSVRAVNMVYDGVHAVRSASFDLETGKFLTILGPSGSGKTTLLRLIAGFQRPTSGEIFINGAAVSTVPPHRRSIGMVFQKLALFPHMTAAENVAFPLKMRRSDVRDIPARVERYLDMVRLGGYGARRVHELSGGQQQRVAIARALVFEPDLLLLDEPLAALDRKLREEMQLEFRRIQRELGVTTINVTHDQREALVVSDEIIVMDGGEIQQKAKPAETYRKPSNAFVANFIGVTNFLDALDGERRAIRAEKIRIAPDRAGLAGADTIVEGIVMDAIFEGERVVYEVQVASLGDRLLRVFDYDPAAHSQLEAGSAVHLGWAAGDVLEFKP
ncbi:ABC transporter ATP-binding protein [Pararhizobium gei]|uniref:ABC transporter ATP-binding protein n=1 Tax=Pararhizobium gei TaxID=1395951 RepID=UPI0023D995A6|nr:ABC transporter ATP-binding protein [Rhizobium gei]